MIYLKLNSRLVARSVRVPATTQLAIARESSVSAKRRRGIARENETRLVSFERFDGASSDQRGRHAGDLVPFYALHASAEIPRTRFFSLFPASPFPSSRANRYGDARTRAIASRLPEFSARAVMLIHANSPTIVTPALLFLANFAIMVFDCVVRGFVYRVVPEEHDQVAFSLKTTLETARARDPSRDSCASLSSFFTLSPPLGELTADGKNCTKIPKTEISVATVESTR